MMTGWTVIATAICCGRTRAAAKAALINILFILFTSPSRWVV
jgi:hypothetical protein